MRFNRLTVVMGLGAMWFIGGGCGQEAPPSKPASSMVQKKIQKPEEAPPAPKPAEAQKDEAVQKIPSEPPATTPAKAPAEAKPPENAPAAAPTSPPGEPKPSAEKPAEGTEGPAALPAAPVPEQRGAYEYVPGDRPDPFRPFFEEAKVAAPPSECEGVPPGPLTEQEASQFTLVAVVGQGSERVAMVQDRTGKGYVLRVGIFLGKKCGKVSTIGSDGVTVEEPYTDLLGQKQTRKIALEFKKTEGGRR